MYILPAWQYDDHTGSSSAATRRAAPARPGGPRAKLSSSLLLHRDHRALRTSAALVRSTPALTTLLGIKKGPDLESKEAVPPKGAALA